MALRMALDAEGTGTDPEKNPLPDDDPAALLDQERAERLRLEGENRQLREQIAAPPKPKEGEPPAQLTAEDVEKALAAGDITPAQASRLFAKIEGQKAAEELEAKREQQEAFARANEKIAGFVRANPELKNRNSPTMQRVAQELRVVQTDYGMNPEDPRAQALAIERVLGPGRTPMPDDRDYDRLRRSGGGGVGQYSDDGGQRGQREPQPKSKGERLFTLLLPEFQTFYVNLRGSKEAAIKTLDYADEASLRKAGRIA